VFRPITIAGLHVVLPLEPTVEQLA